MLRRNLHRISTCNTQALLCAAFGRLTMSINDVAASRCASRYRLLSTASKQSSADALRRLAELNAGDGSGSRGKSSKPSQGVPTRSRLVKETPTLQDSLAAQAPAGSASAAVLEQSSLGGLLRKYMASRADLDLMTCCLALARASMLWRPRTSDEDLLRGDACRALIGDTMRHMQRAAALQAPPDPRVLAGLLHSLAKLSSVVRHSQLFSITSELCTSRLHELPPRSLAMAAWALAKSGVPDDTLFLHISELSTTGTCASWPPYTPQLTATASSSSSPRKAADARNAAAQGSPFEPTELSMLATAFATAQVRNPAVYDRIARYALPLLPHFTHAALVSLSWAFSAPIGRASTRNSGPNIDDSRLKVLFLLADEMSLRLDNACRHYGGPQHISDSNAASLELDRRQMAAVAATRAKLSASGFDDASSNDDARERTQYISARSVATILHTFATAGTRPPQLLASAARYLSSISPSSGSDTGGAAGYRALGTRSADRVARGNDGESSASHVSALDGDVAVVSTFDSESMANIAWSYARCRYDSPSTHAMWAAMQASATARVQRLTQLQDQERSEVGKDQNSGSSRASRQISMMSTKPHHVATLCWAASRSSIAAQPLLRCALRHAGSHTASYSIPALAQILWSAALQNTYDATAFKSIFEHILALAEQQQSKASANDDAAASSDHPDSMAAALLQPAGNGARGVSKIQSQLHIALRGILVDQPVAASEAGISDLVPASVQEAWFASVLKQEPRSSALQSSVSRVLTSAGIQHLQEHMTPEGLLCDVVIHDTGSIGASNGAAHKHALKAGERGIVIEVQGPVHFIRGIDVAQSMTRDSDTGTVSFKPLDMMLSSVSDGLPADASITNSKTLDAARSVLVPDLRTRAKTRWLKATGYRVIAVNFAEWAGCPSTQEKLELLYEKGVPVPEKLLSWG